MTEIRKSRRCMDVIQGRSFAKVLLLILPSMLGGATAARGQTLWTDGTGSWFAASNSSLGVPDAGSAPPSTRPSKTAAPSGCWCPAAACGGSV